MKSIFTPQRLVLVAMAVLAVALYAAGLLGTTGLGLSALAIGATNYVGEGERLVLVAPYAVTVGGGAKVGTALFGVAIDTVASAGTGVFATEGIWDITKTTTAAFAAGDKAYWDDTNKRLTTTSTSNLPVGVVIEAAATTGTTARVKLAPACIVAAGS
jgi:predicted RecA/RadA family phage recombinase